MTGLRHLVLVWLLIGVSIADVFDVTTIHRYDRLGENFEDIADDFIRIPVCRTEEHSGCEDWTFSDWTLTDNSQTLIPTPGEGRHRVNIEDNRTSPLFPLSSESGNRIAFTLKKYDLQSPVFLYLSTENETRFADINIVELRQNYVSLYECVHYKHLHQPISGESRKCEEISTETFHPDLDIQHIVIDHWWKVTLIGRTRKLLQNISNKFLREIKYAGIKSTNYEFETWTPVQKRSLAKSRGVIESWGLHVSRSKAVCLSVLYYLQPYSDATIRVYLALQNGSEVLLGSVQAPRENVCNPWSTHRFIRELDSSTLHTTAKIRIVSEKSAFTDVFIKNITLCGSEDNVNTTTIHRSTSTEVHARTNALGLPLLLPDENPLYLDDILSPCTPRSDSKCEWSLSDPITVPDERSFSEESHGRENSRSIRMSNEVGSTELFVQEMNFTFSPSESNGQLNIYLMARNKSISSVNLYYISIWNDAYRTSRLWKCICSKGEHIQISSTGVNRYCQQLQTGSLGSSYWTHNNEYRFTVSYAQGRLKLLRRYNDGTTVVIFDWLDSEPIPVRYYSLGMMGMTGSVLTVPSPWSHLFILHDMDSITSPSFTPRDNNVCVSVTYNNDYNSSENHLNLEVVQTGEESLSLSLVNSVRMDDDWITNVYAAQLELDEQPIAIKLTANIINEFIPLVIKSIAGCKFYDGEEIHIISSTRGYTDIGSYGYDMYVDRSTEDQHERLDCMNGGIFDAERGGCECPPGFAGATCEKGCGPNRFGSDCGGKCSITTRGCKRMTLCRPKLGCSCGPGLKGVLCDIACDRGEYGAGCKQKCGNCSNEDSCDPYTGRCPRGCKDGLYPPLCQQSYTHLSLAPEAEGVGFDKLKVMFNTDKGSLEGRGNPRFYQLQIREFSGKWKELQPRLLPSIQSVEAEINGLEPGTPYQVRTIFIDEDGNSYQGPKVPTVNATTKCVIPKEIDYNIQAVPQTEDQLKLTWNYNSESALWCKLLHSEVELKMDTRWFLLYRGEEMTYTMTNLLPGNPHEVRVRAYTSGGPAPFSKTLSVSTKYKAPGDVSNLQVVSKRSRELELKWEEPLDSEGKIQRYKVSYKCQKLLACATATCNDSAGQVEVSSTSVALRNLLPHAQYTINVQASAASWGPASSIQAVTDMTVPDVAPVSGPVSSSTVRTNTSFTVQWAPPHSCRQLNGYLYEYRFELLAPNDTSHVQEGFTHGTTASFKNLTPHTQYTVKVFSVTSGGWNPAQPLVITTTTRATVPGPVQDLVIYKRDRRTLAIRWAAPKELYGRLQSFTVSYRAPGQQIVRSVVKPTSCVAWPKLFCHTFKTLRPDVEYTVMVQAKNDEVDEDGEPAEVVGITRESAPLAPSFVRVASQTQRNLTVEWGQPNLLNGKLRSFLLNVEETESYNSTDCCQYFPIQEIPVRAEQASYRVQVSDLNPASTYAISITAKTVAMGPAVSITTHTRPPVPSMDGMIEVQGDVQAMSTGPTVVLQPPKDNQDLIRGYLLLVVPQSTDVETLETSIWNDGLSEELKTQVSGNFYVAAEFQQMELEDNTEAVIGTNGEMKTGKWGEVTNPPLQDGGKYSLGLAMILEYCGIYAVGYTNTEAFHVDTRS